MNANAFKLKIKIMAYIETKQITEAICFVFI